MQFSKQTIIQLLKLRECPVFEFNYFLDQLKCLDGVVAGGKCYRLLYRVGVKMSFLETENLCAFHGGVVAEIPNQRIYDAIFQYIRRYWSVDLDARDRNFVQVFLSSLYEVSWGSE